MKTRSESALTDSSAVKAARMVVVSAILDRVEEPAVEVTAAGGGTAFRVYRGHYSRISQQGAAVKAVNLNDLRDVPGGVAVHGVTVNYDRACLSAGQALIGLNLIVTRKALPAVLALLDGLQPEGER